MNLSLQQLEKLYKSAVDFYKVSPWNWMYDTDMFAIKNPANDEIGYCCVLGKLKEVFGLAVYLGTDGLQGYIESLSWRSKRDKTDILFKQKCLTVTFENRNMLSKKDLEMIRKVKLNSNREKCWPVFRSYIPGYYPWYLTNDEAEYFTLVLEQAKIVCLRFKENPNMLKSKFKNHYFARVFDKDTFQWQDKWLEPAVIIERIISLPIDENRIQKIKNLPLYPKFIVECDIFPYFEPVQDSKDERPYYPYAFMIVDHETSFIFENYLAKPANYLQEFQDQFLSFIEEMKGLPGEILVRNEKAYELLTKITKALNIKLTMVNRLKETEKVKREFKKFISRRWY